MANKEELPWDMIEEILSHVPPKSLVRFRTVSKQWNALFSDKRFIHNHKATFRFILTTRSKIYAVSINPKIEVRELTLDVPGKKPRIPRYMVDCNEFLLCDMPKRAVVWNPWLRQTRRIDRERKRPGFQFSAIGYDNGYKTLVSHQTKLEPTKTFWRTYDFSSDAWKDHVGVVNTVGTISATQGGGRTVIFHTTTRGGVSLDGTWYRVAYYNETKNLFFLVIFDFSTGTFHKFCDLPCEGNHHLQDALVLRVFKEDRLSLLTQFHLTKKIQIWVTKNKIHKSGGNDVEWMSFMEVSVPNLPDLVPTAFEFNFQPSYFIDGKTLVVCSLDEIGRPWIYVMVHNKLISKTKIDSVVDAWPLHCTYFPGLVSVPPGQREEAEQEQVISLSSALCLVLEEILK